MIELRFHVPDPRRRLAAVRLAHQLRERLPYELTRNGRAWELTAAAPDVARFEYQFELIDRDGGREWILDPGNPKRASGPWGDKSVWEEPGYAPPDWVAEDPVGAPKAVTIPSKILRRELPALIWAHPDATERSPLLVAHDGPEYAAHSELLTYLGRLPPLRAALIGPVDRNEIYSASARYSRALAEEILPQLPTAPVRIGLGASLGALSLFYTHRRHPESFDALFLQSGSFFRRAESYERQLPALRADRALRRRRPPQPAGTDDPGRARLRHRRGEPARKPRARGVAARPRLRRPFAGVPRRPQLGRVARLLPSEPAPAAPEGLT